MNNDNEDEEKITSMYVIIARAKTRYLVFQGEDFAYHYAFIITMLFPSSRTFSTIVDVNRPNNSKKGNFLTERD